MPPSRTVKTHKRVKKAQMRIERGHPYRRERFSLEDEFADSGAETSSFDMEIERWKFSFQIGIALNNAIKEDPHAMDTSA
ncbi:hypothetical protein BT96DRAFT_995576 [Gymnopus androsaceus JB14]|uniref:Uncharacterized protein n=1 Tax=Gymnopus androsaceus JB14 TaxID=1447944 RepID=A0A6A4HJJ4_9AGAR|nr:hypothetical protein BT96DRAFT_995576 [Gymnopus androsaceus JB14]